jgi:cell division protein FtsZ
MANPSLAPVKVTVVGAGGAGGNAIARMARSGIQGVDLLALNTDVQALSQVKSVRTFAIGPETTRGMGSGGRPETGRKAMKESQEQVSQLLEGSDMVFVASGMGGGTGTGAAPIIADIARRQGALTVGVVTLPFSFEGSQRRETAEQGLRQLREKVDTLIAVENDRLLPALNGDVRLDKAFELADEVLRQGVQGIADLVTVPGMINVDFADVKAVMRNGGPTYMAVGEGRGKSATTQAAQFALSNPLFDAPLRGASGILFNVTGGKDLTLGQVHEVADLIREASDSDANVVFGVVQDKRLKGRVSLTLVATGVRQGPGSETDSDGEDDEVGDTGPGLLETVARVASNGHHVDDPKLTTRLF